VEAAWDYRQDSVATKLAARWRGADSLLIIAVGFIPGTRTRIIVTWTLFRYRATIGVVYTVLYILCMLEVRVVIAACGCLLFGTSTIVLSSLSLFFCFLFWNHQQQQRNTTAIIITTFPESLEMNAAAREVDNLGTIT
jgi:hypothetical protein